MTGQPGGVRIRSFAPVATGAAAVLILGSMPGEASLRAGQYYAHPRNLFWRLMGELIGAGPELDYQSRIDVLKAHGFALWDVLESCVRPGSLDSRIAPDSLKVNDFAGFFDAHPGITRVYFNGAKAEALFARHALPVLQGTAPGRRTAARLRFTRLPSTSPAHAALSFEQKLSAWRSVREDG